jgi:hypothetical protein
MDGNDALERVRGDAFLRAQLRTARAWGVSPGRFLGREPARRLVYDALGRPVRVEAEPEWLDSDRDLALALTVYEADACPGCGQPLSETTLPEREGRYKAGLAVRCHHCTASALGAEVYRESSQPSALLIPVEYVPPPPEETPP